MSVTPDDAAAAPAHGSPEGTDAPGWRRAWAVVRFPVTAYVVAATVLSTLVWVSATKLSRHQEYTELTQPFVFRGAGLLEGWVRFDGGWYREIATNGYYFTSVTTQAPVAFFPAYPLTMRVLGYMVGDPLTAGVLLSFLSGFGAVVLFHHWCIRKLGRRTANVAVVTLLVYPYVWYLFGAVYADAFFVCATLAAFVFLDHDRPVLAGLCGAVATASRPVGVGVAIGLFAVLLDQRGVIRLGWAELVQQHGWRRSRWPAKGERPRFLAVSFRRLRPRDAGILLAPVGLGLWMFWLWRTYGDPLLFAHIEQAAGWDQSAGVETTFKLPYLRRLWNLPEYVGASWFDRPTTVPRVWNELVITVGLILQSAFVLGGLLLVPRILRRLGWGFAVYVIAVMLLPLLGSKDFQGTGRYLLAAFPVFAVAGDWLADEARRRVRYVAWAVTGSLLLVLTSGYARGYYVA